MLLFCSLSHLQRCRSLDTRECVRLAGQRLTSERPHLWVIHPLFALLFLAASLICRQHTVSAVARERNGSDREAYNVFTSDRI